jgi:FKBP-type peptidyl-prolyl cis-trans isomerase FklB
MTEELNNVSYAIGLSVASSLKEQNLDQLDPTVLSNAIKDVFENKTPKFTPNEAQDIIQNYLKELSEKQFAKNKEEGEAFLTENAAKTGITTTASGLQYEVVVEGTGKTPSATDVVEVHYHGTLINGNVFDSSIERGTPATFGVNQVIKGWTEALQLMKEGSKYRLYIPQDLAYGAHPHPGGPIEPLMALIFDVELISVK